MRSRLLPAVLMVVTAWLSQTEATAALELPCVYSDYMVLQQKSSVPIWGWDSAYQSVAISCSWGTKASATADARGNWKAVIATPAAGGPHKIAVVGSSTAVISDVLVGEV